MYVNWNELCFSFLIVHFLAYQSKGILFQTESSVSRDNDTFVGRCFNWQECGCCTVNMGSYQHCSGYKLFVLKQKNKECECLENVVGLINENTMELIGYKPTLI